MEEVNHMKKKTQPFLKGPALLALARRKAGSLGIDPSKHKLVELVHLVQQWEGHSACFRRQQECQQRACCWQASCGATMRD
jgi:hypothetical protein